MRLRWRILSAGLLSTAVLAGLYARPSLTITVAGIPRAEAQGVGIFSRPLCTTLTGVVQGQTVCFDQTANAWKVWTGTAWVQSATQTQVNVKDFGAKGDGTTDDTTAIQNAMNAACPNGTVIFPSGTYIHSLALTPPSYCTILGLSNAVIKAVTGASDAVMGFQITGKTRIVLQGLIYDGNRTNRTPTGGITAFGIFVSNSSNITIRDMIVQNSLWDGIELAYTNNADALTRSSNIIIDNTIVTNSRRNGLTVDGAKDVTCLNSQFNGSDAASPRAGIDVEADNGTIFNENIWFLNCEANGNIGDGLTFAQFNKTSGVIGGRYSGNNGFGIAINTGGAGAIPDNYGVAVWYPQMENNGLGPFRRLATQAAVNYFSTTTATNTIDAGNIGGTWPLVPTSTNTNSTIILRDSSGNFAANQITGNSYNIGSGGNNGSLSFSTDLLFLGPTSGAFLIRGGNAATPVVVMRSFAGNATVTTFNLGVQVGGNPTGGDQGAGTINIASAAYGNGLAASVASATGVNLMSVRGISATQAIANNLRGTCTFAAAATCAVSFARNEPDASYFVALGPGAAAAANVMPYGVTSKAVSGFTITATVSNSNAVDWILIH